MRAISNYPAIKSVEEKIANKEQKMSNPTRIEFVLDLQDVADKVHKEAYDAVVNKLTSDIQETMIRMDSILYYRSYEESLTYVVEKRIKDCVQDTVDQLVKENKDAIIERAADKLALRLARTKAANQIIE